MTFCSALSLLTLNSKIPPHFKLPHFHNIRHMTWHAEDRGGSVEEEERRRRLQLVERFQTAPFEEIAAHCGARVSDL